MGIEWQFPSATDQEAPCHPEVNQQNEIGFEADNYILSPSIDAFDALALEQSFDDSRIDRTR